MKKKVILLTTGVLLFILVCALYLRNESKQLPDLVDTSKAKSFQLWPTVKKGGIKGEDFSTWGGSVVKGEDGRYHMFVSAFENDCGLSSWEYNSKIVRASSESPLGPFEIEETVVTAMSHNPTIRKTKDGSYYLFFIGEPKTEEEIIEDCEKGITYETDISSFAPWCCKINVMKSNSVFGPWSEAEQLTNLLWYPICTTNPAPVIDEDGKMELFYRAYDLFDDSNEYLYKTSAESVYASLDRGQRTKILAQEAEDAFVWKDVSGYYMIFNNKFKDDFNTGGLAYSADGLSFQALDPLFSKEIHFDDGTSLVAFRRERPQILWLTPDKGVLYTSVQESNETDKIYTTATPIGAWEKR